MKRIIFIFHSSTMLVVIFFIGGLISTCSAVTIDCNTSDSLTLGLQKFVENIDNRPAGQENSVLLANLLSLPCFNGEFRFTRGKWPLASILLNSSHKDVLIRGSGAHLIHTGMGNFVNITGVNNIILKELVFEGNDTSSIIYMNGCQSSTIDTVTTIGGTYGLFLEQALFDIHVRNSYIYGASEVGIFIGPDQPIGGAQGATTNVEIFIDETRIHGCKTVSCCNIHDDSCRHVEFSTRTQNGIVIEGGNSGVYIQSVSMAWTRRSGFTFSDENQLMPSEYVFIRTSLVDSIRKYDDTDTPRGYQIISAADVSLSDNWAGSVEGDGVYVDRLMRNENSFLKLTDFRIINCQGNAFFFTGRSNNSIVMMGNNMMSLNEKNGIAGNTSTLKITQVSASIPSQTIHEH